LSWMLLILMRNRGLLNAALYLHTPLNN
jgi:hypothetical protein